MGFEERTASLGDYFGLQRGTTYKGMLKGKPGPVLLGLASIQRNGGFRHDNLSTYGGDCPGKLLVNAGELFVSLKDVTQAGDLLGAVAMVPQGAGAGRLTQDTVKLVPKRNDVPIDYLYWLLRAPQTRDLCRSRATGTTNLGLARDDFLSIPVPPLDRTRKLLVSLLGALDDKIELNRKMNQTLEQMAQAIFKSWFVDFDGHDPADMVESELGFIPKQWRPATLGDLAELNPESWGRSTRPAVLDYVDLGNTKWGRIESTTIYASDDAPSRAQRVLRPGDTIVGTVRPGNGAYALILDPGLTGSTGFAVLRPRRHAYTAFVYLAATAGDNIARLAHLADGGAYPAVRPDLVAASAVVRADDGTLERFASCVDPLLARIAHAQAESRTLTTLRDTLLPKLISGEIRVPDAEATIAAAT